jgi:hypothetical protein
MIDTGLTSQQQIVDAKISLPNKGSLVKEKETKLSAEKPCKL